MFYLITWHESDGNDCTVFDTVIGAASQEEALTALATAVEKALTDSETEFEEDGSEFGYYFHCTKECPEECDGHGGIALRTVEEYPTLAEARANMAQWHSEYVI